ncbi:hypothetical protein [Longimicrobium sp.]|uniref:DUF3108 domain-containing protein n=1 Tax=Longimicrobium sp. TaxID=2029185 RepID=UPI002E362E31|nr:hypothetical protein [Longimicrobium sp.]HEX6041962.1 hypothetical protein [Longimicrobium sp.]
MRTLIAAALLVCLAAPALPAQDAPIRPGGIVSGARVADRTDHYDVYESSRTDGAPDAKYVMETRLAEADGRPVVIRRERMRIDGTEVEVSAFTLDHRTLAPLGGKDGAFLAGSMDLLLGALPLADGYTAALAVRDEEDGAPLVADVRVAGREEVRTDRGPVRAWRISVAGSGSEGTYWLREDTRTLVQFVAADRGMRMVLHQRAADERDAR